MDYSKKYQEKLVTAEKAAAAVQSGDWVDYGWSVCTTVAVDAALAVSFGLGPREAGTGAAM